MLLTFKHGCAVAVGGLVLAAVLAPMLAAERPLPAPTIERVELLTADRLDTGPACIYTWNGELYQWTREDLGIAVTQPCPSRTDARARWDAAQQGPQRLTP